MIAFVILALATILPAGAQTFQRLGTCPTLGCVFPPDQTSFIAGGYFDIRLEVHAPVNGSEAYNNGSPDGSFKFTIKYEDEEAKPVTEYFGREEAELETWDFDYFEDLFAQDAGTPTIVNVASKAYRKLALYKPGKYEAKLTYYNGFETVAHWNVRKPCTDRKAKNVILFIGDGMTTSMITAARLLGHKSINGEYQTLMQMDQMNAIGHQMTHSIDSFITDSANSATALYTGKKSTVNALNVFRDSSPDGRDPKFETVAELFARRIGGALGIVSTAYIADATPAALCAHTRSRNQYGLIVEEYLNGNVNATTLPFGPGCMQPDVIFGGGAEQFLPSPASFNGSDYYELFAEQGYNVVQNATSLEATSDDQKTLGIFTVSTMSTWLDRNVYTEGLQVSEKPDGSEEPALDQPGLKQMTLKAIDILSKKAKKDGKGFFLMSEAASIDKQMHSMDYHRALGELLEFDDTIRQTLNHLKEIGELEDTLVVVTADHGHGFDVYGSTDTQYLREQSSDRSKRSAIGIYEQSGLSGYTVANGTNPKNNTIVFGEQGVNFPVNWDPRYAIAAGLSATPDHNEAGQVNTTHPRIPAVEDEDEATPEEGYIANPDDQPQGFAQIGNLPIESASGVHSLTDVPVFASGPYSESFRGVYNSIEIFYKIADALALGRTSEE